MKDRQPRRPPRSSHPYGRSTGRELRTKERERREAASATAPRATSMSAHTAEGVDRTGKPGFKVAITMYDEDDNALVAAYMRAADALDVARTLIVSAAGCHHLEKYHPTGRRDECKHEEEIAAQVKAGTETIIDQAFGPLAKTLRMGSGIVAEVEHVLSGLRTIALEEGLYAPEGVEVSMELGQAARVSDRVDKLVAIMGNESRALLIQVFYLLGSELLARMFGIEPHVMEEGEVH